MIGHIIKLLEIEIKMKKLIISSIYILCFMIPTFSHADGMNQEGHKIKKNWHKAEDVAKKDLHQVGHAFSKGYNKSKNWVKKETH